MSLFKICSKCNIEKSFESFSKSSSSKDGLQYKCKHCCKILSLERYKVKKVEMLAKNKQYREANKQKISAYSKTRRETDTEIVKAVKKKYRDSNRCELNAKNRKYKAENLHKVSAWASKRRANKLQATPPWLTLQDYTEIEDLYLCARMFKLYTGQEYHVDHIIPLQGKTVCGLHVPWNLQVIPAKENLRKSNKI
jgi:hypothetical protein